MHYTTSGVPVVANHRDFTLDQHILRTVLSDFPEVEWRETDDVIPFYEDTSIPTIVAACMPHCTGEGLTNAVYVLECLNVTNHRQRVWQVYQRSKHWHGEVAKANRVLYVGVTVNLVRRLNEHLNSPGEKGANFTGVFPPMRILDVSWYRSYWEACRAEVRTAELLRERFPNDYISQPG